MTLDNQEDDMSEEVKMTIFVDNNGKDLPADFCPAGVRTFRVDSSNMRAIMQEMDALLNRYQSHPEEKPQDDKLKIKGLENLIFEYADRLNLEQSAKACWLLANMVTGLWTPGRIMSAWLNTYDPTILEAACEEAAKQDGNQGEYIARHVAEVATFNNLQLCITLTIFALGATIENLEEILNLLANAGRL
jgi:hypothetical protein